MGKIENLQRVQSPYKKSGGHMRSFRIYLTAIFFLLCSQSGLSQTIIETDSVDSQLRRARVLAAMGKHTAAAEEFEQILQTEIDESVREVVGVLLMGVYFELADYGRARALLNSSFSNIRSGEDSQARSYFALCGKVLNSTRSRLERYSQLGLNISDNRLPEEATKDILDLRTLMEHIAAQSKTLLGRFVPKSREAAALLEESAALRQLFATTEEEKLVWQEEVHTARTVLVPLAIHQNLKPYEEARPTQKILPQNLKPASLLPVEAPFRASSHEVRIEELTAPPAVLTKPAGPVIQVNRSAVNNTRFKIVVLPQVRRLQQSVNLNIPHIYGIQMNRFLPMALDGPAPMPSVKANLGFVKPLTQLRTQLPGTAAPYRSSTVPQSYIPGVDREQKSESIGTDKYLPQRLDLDLIEIRGQLGVRLD
jgi:tetratricopeptide (TPR) repeat protein